MCSLIHFLSCVDLHNHHHSQDVKIQFYQASILNLSLRTVNSVKELRINLSVVFFLTVSTFGSCHTDIASVRHRIFVSFLNR